MLSLLTKIASGYWHVADSQAGYTAISLETLERLDLDRIYTRYGFPNDLLVHLNVWQRPRARRPLAPDLRRRRALGDPAAAASCRASRGCSLKGFFWRMREKYVIRDFHPLVFFYALGILMTLAGLGARDPRDGPADHRATASPPRRSSSSRCS